jgi:hypothetical protein
VTTFRRNLKVTTLAFAVCVAAVCGAHAQGNLCGLSPSDWCEGPLDDPCSGHHSTDACRADRQCFGVPYRGESLVACIDDGQRRGFARNCPTVGCSSVPPQQQPLLGWPR